MARLVAEMFGFTARNFEREKARKLAGKWEDCHCSKTEYGELCQIKFRTGNSSVMFDPSSETCHVLIWQH